MSATAAAPRTPATEADSLADAMNRVQSLVLRTPEADTVHHLLIRFSSSESARNWLNDHLPCNSMTFGPEANACETALGFTWDGLEQLGVPDPVLGVMRHLAPAYAAGAAVRSATHLGDIGASAARHWDSCFSQRELHAVLSVHGPKDQCCALVTRQRDWFQAGRRGGVHSYIGQALSAPSDALSNAGRWVHFGYRDGITQPAIDVDPPERCATSRHEPGELLLGHARDTGDNPWSLTTLPQEIRAFFHDGSFGVLRVIEQNAEAFEIELERWARVWTDFYPGTYTQEKVVRFIRAKLCGRWPEGPVILPSDGPDTDISGRLDRPDAFSTDFQHDEHGSGCPYASHVRRMRGEAGGAALAQPRVLFRRSLPYGDWWTRNERTSKGRGLLGLFFCSSIEDQFEHLLRQWVDRMPLGLADGSSVKDPLIGAHDDPNATFVLHDGQATPLKLWGFGPFVRTRGTTYLFYPSLHAFTPLLDNRKWVAEAEPWLP